MSGEEVAWWPSREQHFLSAYIAHAASRSGHCAAAATQARGDVKQFCGDAANTRLYE
jgi:hypothetical protein